MSAPAFDSLEFAFRLKEAGVPQQLAEVMVETFGFHVDKLVNKEYLDARFARRGARLEQHFSRLDVELNAMAAVLAIIAASVVPLALGTLIGG